mmetsp:Transcript_1579/g.2474  ORF Transcript_1579/g.2474 Transcript_1579/m.2474 type:complete len:216 (-) Transcript_1579:122-769(-)
MDENRDDKKARIVLSLLTVLFSATALSLAYVGTLDCHYVSFTSTHEEYEVKAGIWSYLNYTYENGDSVISESCQTYPTDVDIDATWKAARAFSVLAVIFGSILFLFSLVVVYQTVTERRFSTGGCDTISLFLTGIFQGLCLLFLGGNGCKNVQTGQIPDLFRDSCVISTGAKCSMASAMFWSLASLMNMQLDIERQRARVIPLTADITSPLIFSK